MLWQMHYCAHNTVRSQGLTVESFVRTVVFMSTKRRKAVRKDAHINVRLTIEQKDELSAAATHAGLGVSSWLLTVGLERARKTNGDKGKG